MCVRAHMHTPLPAKDFILVLELRNLIEQTTTKLLLKEQLYTTIFNHVFRCFFSYLIILGADYIITSIKLLILKILNAM